jgi:hypothetical protein
LEMLQKNTWRNFKSGVLWLCVSVDC